MPQVSKELSIQNFSAANIGMYRRYLGRGTKSGDETKKHTRMVESYIIRNRKMAAGGVHQMQMAKSVEQNKSERQNKRRIRYQHKEGEEVGSHEMMQSPLQKNLSSSHFNNNFNQIMNGKRSTLDQQHHKCLKIAMASQL